MRRRSLQNLKNWSQKASRTPLLLRGARQVGKTWLIREHGKDYAHFLEINLESQPEYIRFFEAYSGNPKELCRLISLEAGIPIAPGKTLLFIDEIQESKEALLSLRYFKEQLQELHVIAAGSLLEFAFKEISFPVGRIEFQYLFPMSFTEFLEARGKNELTADLKKITPEIHEMLLKETALYHCIGGMPEVLKTYFETQDLAETQNKLQALAATYRADFNKYASKTQVEYLKIIFDQIPGLFGQKFKYSMVSKEIKSRELSQALYLLESAGLCYRCYHSSSNGIPLGSEKDISKFKVFFLDIGLAQRILGLPLQKLFIEDRKKIINRCGLAEQFVAQELVSTTEANHFPVLYYWHREEKSAQAEVDFIFQYEDKVIPIEVKSGTDKRSKSLKIFMDEKKIDFSIRVSSLDFEKMQKGILSIPFYFIGNLQFLKTQLSP